MSSRPDCPGSESWRALLDVNLPPEQRRRFEQHLEACPACQERIDQAQECQEHLRRLGQRFGDPTLAEADPTLVQVRRQLHEGKPSTPATPAEPAELHFLRPTDRPGVLGLLGEYEVREVIGQGGMGVVLKTYEPALHRLVAIKVLAPALAGSANARRRFTREARAAAAVCHEHVVAVHGVEEVKGLPYLVMQYVAGESLQQRLDRDGPLELTDLVRVGLQAASGLAAAHAQGLIHRDVKPANLLLEGSPTSPERPRRGGPVAGAPGLGDDGPVRVKITDFGLARTADDAGLTRQGVVAGTPEYMAPEQARGEAVDHRADLFSLGCVLYACCTGRPPFRGSTALAVLREVSDAVPAPVGALNPAVPAWLEQFIARLLAKDPAERIQTAAEAATLLEGYLSHLRQPAAVSAPPLPCPRPREPGARRPSRLVSLSAVLLAGLVLGLSMVALGVTGAAGRPANIRDSYHHDFRGRALPSELKLFGDNDDQFLKAEPEGLRITIPDTYIHPWGGVGLLTAFGFRGDFEVTTTVQVLHADVPLTGYGVGVGMRLQMAAPSPEGATLCRMVRAEGSQVLVWDHALDVPADTEPRFEAGEAPCPDTVVRLRLKRTGTTLQYLWAPGTDGDDFQVIHECAYSADDVESVRLTALTGRQPCKVDVRLLDFRVRATGQPAHAATQKVGRKGWRAAALLGLAVLLAAGVWLCVRQGRRTGPVPTLAPEGPGQTKATPALPVAFACAGCGKRLKARATLAGKEVKCPQCGRAVLVPRPDAGEAARPTEASPSEGLGPKGQRPRD